ncbi:hypothetical protein [Kutzneria kofuensis]|uniref:Uncharacterized protein n=1 Tax=Kutzneria kofuensis TaxID=103725 RepID=A0A7W9KAH3_9PSEU|nr:hypothetical protein [Kutzneria kofuensis]MBB5889033.1 hypothetical protein [Kutzneria kofuensis]
MAAVHIVRDRSTFALGPFAVACGLVGNVLNFVLLAAGVIAVLL